MTTRVNQRRKYLGNEEKDELDELYRRISILESQNEEHGKLIAQRPHYSVNKEPDWINNYAQVDPPLEPFTYRVVSGQYPIFKGHVDVSAATSGDPAFVLKLGKDINGDPIELPYDVRDHIVLTDDGGTSFIMGLAKIDSTTLEFTIIWPAS